MSTVDKALGLLDLLEESRPEIGLSELSRLSGHDKATVLRMMAALARHGLVEQHPTTRLYRLGAGILRLARIREATFPVAAVLQPALARLAAATGETAHASLYAGGKLATVGIAESDKAIRVSLQAGQVLPLHATASGLAFLAFSPARLAEACLAADLPAYTEHTETGPERLRARLEQARAEGVAVGDQGLERDVCGIAAPLFASTGEACGAIAVATPSHRMSEALQARIAGLVAAAAVEVTRGLGAEPPAGYASRASRQAA